MSAGSIVGWDIGGAHLKASVVSPQGAVLDAVQLTCEIWRGTDRLHRAAKEILSGVDPGARHVVTMTAELADIFPDRASGVAEIVAVMHALLPEEALRVYGGRHGFIAPKALEGRVDQIASANWLGAASFVARQVCEALFVDIGSTTTDLVSILGGAVATTSVTDADRLVRDELVYTGVVRTPVCALVNRVPFRGSWQSVAAEVFATTGDCYRLLDSLSVEDDHAGTADGRGKSPAESARRLARMLGRDAREEELAEWRQLASHIARTQLQGIQDAADTVVSRAGLAADAPVVGAGAGRFLAARMAGQMQRPFLDVVDLVEVPAALRDRAAVCFPSLAIALLAQQDG